MEGTLETIETNKVWTKNTQVNQLVNSFSQFFWSVLDVVSSIQISIDAELTEDNLVKSRKAAYLISGLLMALFVLTAPDKIPSILSSTQIDTTKVLERTHEFINTIRKLLPAF